MEYNSINEGTSMMVNNIQEQEFFLSHLTKDSLVLEFGSGQSTLTIAPLVKHLTTIEHDVRYGREVQQRAADAGITNITFIVVPADKEPSADYDDGTYEDFKTYIHSIIRSGPDPDTVYGDYDVIFIDGRARVECAKMCALGDPAKNISPVLQPHGIIFIHDYRHPQEEYRRKEYEVVETFLNHVGQVFALGKFTAKSPQELALIINPHVCWYKDEVITEMNAFYDKHLKNFDLTAHYKSFTDLLYSDHLLAEEGAELLDLGCGTGILSEFVKDFTYYGADLPHVVAGCAMRNYSQYFYRGCDIYKDDMAWISQFDVVVINGLLDVMEHPIAVLQKIVESLSVGCYLIIHRQEITRQGKTQTEIRGSYGSVTYHSIINRKDFEDVLAAHDCIIEMETICGFSNWEDGGKSFLIEKSFQKSNKVGDSITELF